MTATATLEISTPSDRELAMSRTFDAPRRLVFDAFTQPDLIRRWMLGPPGWTMTVCEMDLRVGGRYRYVWCKEDGTEMGMGGEIRELEPPERLTSTERFDESWYPGEAVWTVLLTEENGRTTMTQTVLYESREARDAVLASPAAEGAAMSYERLAELLASIEAEGTEG
jgi:uncharacterized protein YndB with AHSA1/START domain